MKLPKYRAWDYNYKKMWKVVAMSEPTYDDCEEPYIKVCEFDKSPMDKETDIRLSFNFDLMQFTGLYDKNGKEIYEGDICETVTYSGKPFGTIDVVKFSGGAFKLTDIEDALLPITLDDSDIKSVEVIGNIYEHKHLLEGTE